MRFLVTLALLFSITPGMSEVAEAAVHLITHADLPHHDDEAGQEGCAEHTCTPLAHHCGCHATMSAQAARTITTTNAFCDMTQVDPNGVTTVFGRAYEPPPLRPPIA